MNAEGRKARTQEAIRRLDRWLWFARLVKSRSLAARLVAAGAVDLNGIAVKKPGHRLRPGDQIVLRAGAYRRSLRVIDLGIRRGPAGEARALYEETATPRRLCAEGAAWTLLLDEEPRAGEGRLS